MKKLNPSLIGFLQALGVVIYCGLIGGLFRSLDKFFVGPGFLNIVLVLILIVFSAAITGLIVFGYPAFLFLNKKIKRALSVLGFTFLYCLVIIGVIIMIILFYNLSL